VAKKSIVSWRVSLRAASLGSSAVAASCPRWCESDVLDEVVAKELEGLLASIASTSASKDAVIWTFGGAA